MATMADLLRQEKGRMLSIGRLSSAAIAVKTLEYTPVLTGTARASWNASIGEPVTKNVEIRGGGFPQRNNITETVNRLQLGDIFSLANGQPYIRPLEDGWSAKAPHGMVKRAIEEWQQIVDAVQ